MENTLSESGTVNRGICKVSENNQLIDVKETLKISRKDDGKVTNKDGQEIDPRAVASMNFWGFHHAMFIELEKEFHAFVLENEKAENTTKEFYIPSFVDVLIKDKKMTCDVLESQDARCGVTYPEDKPEVTKTLNKLIAN